MRPISKKVKDLLSKDPKMKECVWCGTKIDITWEHCWVYGGKQIDEAWAIVGLCRYHHIGPGHTAEIKDYCRWQSLLKATTCWEEVVTKYSKRNWKQEKDYLTNKFIKV
jgi:hypothetical protein